MDTGEGFEYLSGMFTLPIVSLSPEAKQTGQGGQSWTNALMEGWTGKEQVGRTSSTVNGKGVCE